MAELYTTEASLDGMVDAEYHCRLQAAISEADAASCARGDNLYRATVERIVTDALEGANIRLLIRRKVVTATQPDVLGRFAKIEALIADHFAAPAGATLSLREAQQLAANAPRALVGGGDRDF